MKKTVYPVALGVVALVAAGSLWAQPERRPMHSESERDHVMCVPKDLQWKDGPASLPSGAQMAVLEGDPAASGPFTFRLKLPANYEVPAHHHPQIEHVTVISGTFSMGTGEKLNKQKATELPAGGFAVMQIGTRHFAFTGDEEAVVQIHGIGPWGITYVDPATDPRNKTRTR